MNDIVENILNPIDHINEQTSVALEVQNALGYAMPPFVLQHFSKVFPVKKADEIVVLKSVTKDPEQFTYEDGLFPVVHVVPLEFRLESEAQGFTFPLDPMVGISSRNIITRRYVSKSKMRGSIKECWSEDDFEINIVGVFIDDDGKLGYKASHYLRKLMKYCKASESIHVKCDLFNECYGITRIAIESYNFPFTKGIGNQSFSIKAYSDDGFSLLEETK